MFNCNKCGLCCQNLNEYYLDLDRGDGVCRYFNEKTRLCDIYEKRPIKCRVDDFYDMYLKHTISKEDYYKMNYDACNLLKNKY